MVLSRGKDALSSMEQTLLRVSSWWFSETPLL